MRYGNIGNTPNSAQILLQLKLTPQVGYFTCCNKQTAIL
jgi:hypothetical protein